jgi:hypothetical protein
VATTAAPTPSPITLAPDHQSPEQNPNPRNLEEKRKEQVLIPTPQGAELD